MSVQTLRELKCRACEKEFFIYPETFNEVDADLCLSCKSFRTYMAFAMQPKSWEKPPSHTGMRWFGLGLLCLSPLWLVGLYLFIHR